MLVFVCAFLPPVLSVAVYEKLAKADLSVKRWIYMYAFSSVMVNLFVWVMLRLQGKYTQIDSFTVVALVYYMLFAVLAAVVFPVAAVWIRKNVEIRVEKDEKTEQDA